MYLLHYIPSVSSPLSLIQSSITAEYQTLWHLLGQRHQDVDPALSSCQKEEVVMGEGRWDIEDVIAGPNTFDRVMVFIN